MISVVYATARATIMLPNGARAIVPKGSHWPADDPVVTKQPELFSADPRWGMSYSEEPEGYSAPVEAASASPGERRAVPRPPR